MNTPTLLREPWPIDERESIAKCFTERDREGTVRRYTGSVKSWPDHQKVTVNHHLDASESERDEARARAVMIAAIGTDTYQWIGHEAPPAPSSYDPWAHVEELDVTVGWHPLQFSNGLWIPADRRIALSTKLPPWAIRPILAHEAAHAEHDDPPGDIEAHETRCDRLAAARQFDAVEWERVHSIDVKHSDQRCVALRMTRPQYASMLERA